MKFNRRSFLIIVGIACIILLLPALYNVTSGIYQSIKQSNTSQAVNINGNSGLASSSNVLGTPRVTRENIDNPGQQPLLSLALNIQNVSLVVTTSQKYIGAPYAPGGVSPSGFDSSGFIQYVFKQHGISLPRSTADQFKMGTAVKDLVSGDLVFFNTSGSGVSHVGIYIGNGRFISTTVNKGVKIDHLEDSYWAPRFMGGKRL